MPLVPRISYSCVFIQKFFVDRNTIFFKIVYKQISQEDGIAEESLYTCILRPLRLLNCLKASPCDEKSSLSGVELKVQVSSRENIV